MRTLPLLPFPHLCLQLLGLLIRNDPLKGKLSIPQKSGSVRVLLIRLRGFVMDETDDVWPQVEIASIVVSRDGVRFEAFEVIDEILRLEELKHDIEHDELRRVYEGPFGEVFPEYFRGVHPPKIVELALAEDDLLEGVEVLLVLDVLEEVDEPVVLHGQHVEGGVVAALDLGDRDQTDERHQALCGRKKMRELLELFLFCTSHTVQLTRDVLQP